jgi:chromosomal replication initiation ATPase DnaA
MNIDISITDKGHEIVGFPVLEYDRIRHANDILWDEAVKRNMDVKKIVGPGRSVDQVKARRAIARRLRDKNDGPGLSYPEIGKIIKRHHTTVMYLLGAIKK